MNLPNRMAVVRIDADTSRIGHEFRFPSHRISRVALSKEGKSRKGWAPGWKTDPEAPFDQGDPDTFGRFVWVGHTPLLHPHPKLGFSVPSRPCLRVVGPGRWNSPYRSPPYALPRSSQLQVGGEGQGTQEPPPGHGSAGGCLLRLRSRLSFQRQRQVPGDPGYLLKTRSRPPCRSQYPPFG